MPTQYRVSSEILVDETLDPIKGVALQGQVPSSRMPTQADDRPRQLREQLQQAQEKTSEFYRANGITTADEKADVKEARLGQLSAQVVALQAERSDTQANVSVLKVATVPSATTSASPAAKLSAAAVAGLLLAIVTIVIIEVRDRRLRNAEDVQSTLKQPLLTVLHRRRPRGAPSPVRQLLIQRRPALTNEGIHAAR